MDVLIVVDMQNDFITGSLGTCEAQAILPRVVQKMQNFSGLILATRDTHPQGYLSTQEGRHLPVVHCVQGTEGWQLHPSVEALLTEPPINKPTFGSADLVARLQMVEPLDSITLIGLCTDICVLSNALLLKAFFPEAPISVDASCCAGVTPESHRRALEAMQVCQIQIES